MKLAEKKPGLELELRKFQDQYNSLTLYSRMIDIGIAKDAALILAKYYNRVFYSPLMDLYNYSRRDK